MYAAAGGASLASRQARMRQRQQKKNQQLQAKLHPPKAPGLAGVEQGASTPTRQSKQFHQLPSNYLRAPQAHGRKLSASYTAQSKLLLPIDEGDTQSVLRMRMHSHAHIHPLHHSHAHGQITHQARQAGEGVGAAGVAAAGGAVGGAAIPGHYHYFAAAAAAHGRVSPKLTHRHSGSSSASFQQIPFPKSATATLPLVSQVEATPPATPSGAAVAKTSAGDQQQQEQSASINIPPHHDTIIVTPATPMASPGHVAKLRETDELTAAAAEKQPLTAPDDDDDEIIQPPTGPLERKCSVYRMRRSDAHEYGDAGSSVRRQLRELQFSNQQQQYEPLLTDEPQLLFKGLPNGRKWQQCAYCEEGICVCEHIERFSYTPTTPIRQSVDVISLSTCAQGRAAWLERGRRCSVQEPSQQASCRRWVKRNRIQDASLGGSSDDEDFLGVLRGPSTFANSFLYVGLGTIALGLVIAFVGTGEKGFKTVELRLIGPSLIVLGLICCILRIFFCICPSHCISSNKKTRKKNGNKVDADHTTALLRGESKRVSIARGPQPRYPITHKRSSSKMLNEGMEALRQLATTSLFIQNEQKPSMNRVVPIIKEPENPIAEAPLEMKKLDTELKITNANNRNLDLTKKSSDNEIILTTTSNIINVKATSTAATLKQTAKANKETEHLANITKQATDRQELPSSSSAHELKRQPATTILEEDFKSKYTSSLSTVHGSIDGEPEMETSLMIISPPQDLILARPPLTTTAPNYKTTTSTISFNEGKDVEKPKTITSSTSMVGSNTGAISKIRSKTTPDSKVPKTIPPPPSSASTGAISRIPTSTTTTSYSLYDMPPSTPHTYSSSMRGDPVIRGPLGMPLSALRASTSSYVMPPAPSKIQTSSTTADLVSTTTTISLLPLPPPSSNITTIANTSDQENNQQACIPGQILEPSSITNPLTASLSSPKSFMLSSPGRFAAARKLANTSSTAGSTFLASISQTSTPLTGNLSALAQNQYNTSNAYQLPSTSSYSSSASTSKLLQQFPATHSTNNTAAPSLSSTYQASIFGGNNILSTVPTITGSTAHSNSPATLAPPSTTPSSSSKFEPELLLSPAKLGQ